MRPGWSSESVSTRSHRMRNASSTTSSASSAIAEHALRHAEEPRRGEHDEFLQRALIASHQAFPQRGGPLEGERTARCGGLAGCNHQGFFIIPESFAIDFIMPVSLAMAGLSIIAPLSMLPWSIDPIAPCPPIIASPTTAWSFLLQRRTLE